MANLIPTPIVDKNGKRTTVHKKPQQKASNVILPRVRVSAINVTDEDQPYLISIALRDSPGFSTLGEWGHTIVTEVRDTLVNKGCSQQHLNNAAILADHVNSLEDDEVTRNYYRRVLSILRDNDPVKTQIMVGNKDYFSQNPQRSAQFFDLHLALTMKHGIHADEDGHIRTIDAHLRAQEQYLFQHRTLEPRRSSYILSPEYLRAVEKHADHIDELLAYREQFPPDLTAEKDTFDEEHFIEYLQHGALADGVL